MHHPSISVAIRLEHMNSQLVLALTILEDFEIWEVGSARHSGFEVPLSGAGLQIWLTCCQVGSKFESGLMSR